jgi:exopolysaccharide production protein ExoQ
MPPLVATAVFIVGIAGLFWLDRDPEVRTSKALWIPTAWLLITASRPVSMWVGMTPSAASGDVYIEGSPIDRAVYICLIAAGLAVVVGRREEAGPILRKNWPILLFFSYAALSILWSDFPYVTFKHWIKGISDVVMVLIVLTESSVTDAIKRLVTRAGFLLLPLSVLFIKYYPALGRTLTRSWAMEWTGVATQKNGLGEICLVFGLGLLWRFRSVYKDREHPLRLGRLVAFVAVFGMAIWLLWLCNSMTSICVLAAASMVMLLCARPAFHDSPALVHVLIVAVLAVTLYALFFQSSGALVGALGRNPTITGRTEDWPKILSIPVSRLVGAGYESFWAGPRLQQVWALLQMNITEAHNGYIEMLLNLGWIGVGLLGVLIAAGYRTVTAALQRDPDYGSLRMAYLVAVLMAGLTEATFRMMSPTWIFFLLTTTAAAAESALETGGGEGLGEYRFELGQETGAAVGEGGLRGY